MHQDVIWDYYQNDAPENFSESVGRLSFLLSQLKPQSKVLNIGVGAGQFESLASKAGHQVYALDPIERSIISLREKLDLGDRAKVGYGQSNPFADDMFNAVVISEVIEHLSPEITQATLREIKRVLVTGGQIIGTVPASEDLKKSIVVCPHCGKPFHRWGHLQSFSEPQMRSLLEAHFDVHSVYTRPFFYWSEYNWKGKFVTAARWCLWRLGSHPSYENIVFRATKV
jgi:ubiquinone/menaquinone biosynthesis C-methylase UbiE